MRRAETLARAIEAVPPVLDAHDLEGRLERATYIAELRKEHHAEMTARWKASEFDHLYGKYASRGVVMKPPPRIYVDGQSCHNGRRSSSR